MIRRWAVALTLLVFAMVAAGRSDEASATTYSDRRHWNARTVYVVDRTGAGYAVREAVRRLNYSRGPYLSYRTTVPSGQPYIYVWQTTAMSSGVAGLATTWTSGGHIVKASVKLNSAYDYMGSASMEIVLHELGHTLGLAHTSYTGPSLMQPTIRYPYVTWPSAYDKADLARLYPY